MNSFFKFRMKAFALMTLLLIGFSSAFAQQKKGIVAIIDAGSSGSRLYVYEIGKGSINQLCEVTKTLPLSEVAEHKDSVKTYMDTMTSQYSAEDTVSLYVLATAGMRDSSLKGKAPGIYEKIKNLKQSGKYRIKDAMTISGRYEGLYAWIAANDSLKKNSSQPDNNTNGILEIGGASMQITYIPEKALHQDTINHPQYGILYSKSYLGGGVDKMFEQKTGSIDSLYDALITNLPTLDSTMVFYGLGRPIKTFYDGLQKNENDFNKYIMTLKGHDTKENYHPESNACYINWLVRKLSLCFKSIITKTDISWTKGAAIDILINGREPEPFNYNTPN